MSAKFSTSPLFCERTATFSDCRRYRYTLRIVWQVNLPVAAFIGLNPSTADEFQDDPTIRRCRGFAEREGCGGMLMLNLFAWRSTDPKGMLKAVDSRGPGNRIPDMLRELDTCKGPWIACWGSHGKHLSRGDQVAREISNLQCFGRNRDGSPKHPLYLSSNEPLKPFTKARSI